MPRIFEVHTQFLNGLEITSGTTLKLMFAVGKQKALKTLKTMPFHVHCLIKSGFCVYYADKLIPSSDPSSAPADLLLFSLWGSLWCLCSHLWFPVWTPTFAGQIQSDLRTSTSQKASQMLSAYQTFEQTSLCPIELGSLLLLQKASVLQKYMDKFIFLSLEHSDLGFEVAVNNMNLGPLRPKWKF